MLPLLLRELDDQDAVLGRESDQHDDPDLRIEIERKVAEDNPNVGPKDTDRHR